MNLTVRPITKSLKFVFIIYSLRTPIANYDGLVVHFEFSGGFLVDRSI